MSRARTVLTSRCADATNAMWWCHVTHDRPSYWAIPRCVLPSCNASPTRTRQPLTKASTPSGVPAPAFDRWVCHSI